MNSKYYIKWLNNRTTVKSSLNLKCRRKRLDLHNNKAASQVYHILSLQFMMGIRKEEEEGIAQFGICIV